VHDTHGLQNYGIALDHRTPIVDKAVRRSPKPCRPVQPNLAHDLAQPWIDPLEGEERDPAIRLTHHNRIGTVRSRGLTIAEWLWARLWLALDQ
jgi:hypothetical protein